MLSSTISSKKSTGLSFTSTGDILMSDATPQTAQQDRRYLKMEIPEYMRFAEAVSTQCYLNRMGDFCKLKNAKTKKLKNLRQGIRKSEFLMKSMIWKEQLRLIEVELRKRRGNYH